MSEREVIAVPECDLAVLLAVATFYIESFAEDELMTLPERMRLQQVEDVVEHYGRRY